MAACPVVCRVPGVRLRMAVGRPEQSRPDIPAVRPGLFRKPVAAGFVPRSGGLALTMAG